MDFRDKGVITQLGNIEAKTGLTLDRLKDAVADLGRLKHGEKRTRLPETYGLSFVHADTLLLWCEAQSAGAAQGDPLAAIYAGGKAHLRPIHDALIARVADLGPFELLPKKGYVSLRLAKQFCMIGPTTNSRVDVGINAITLSASGRLTALPAGRLCPLQVSLSDPDQVDDELMAWIGAARTDALPKVSK